MTIPEEFYKFCQCLHQDFMLYGPEPRDWIVGALRNVPPSRRGIVRDFVLHLLTGPYTYEQLQAIWHGTEAEMSCRGEISLRRFLRTIVEVVDGEHGTLPVR